MSWQAVLGTAETVPMRPIPRLVVSEETWRQLGPALAAIGLAPAGLWADQSQIHLLVADDPVRLLSVTVNEGSYPALSPTLPACAEAERRIRDLFGHQAADGIDPRPLLDHGAWTHRLPLSPRPLPAGLADPPEFPSPEGAEHCATGPQRGDLLPPMHERRFTMDGRPAGEDRLTGYLHRGVQALLRGKSPRAAARFIARVDGRASVAHSVAFARAAEAASETEIPPAASAGRDLLLQLEALYALLEAKISLPASRAARRLADARAALRDAVTALAGHPFAFDMVVPGGLSAALPADASRQLEPALVRAAACPVDGIGSACETLRGAAASVPPGTVNTPLLPVSGEGLGMAPGPLGDIWHWLRLDAGQIAIGMPIAPDRGGRLAVPGLDL
jgi:Ni,Fe-hydrogenase III component G